jgi:cyclopropane fatty-acyl-phospholipid synthase-like methyltransferase
MGWEEYYETTQDAEPHQNLVMFLRKNRKPGIAVDLGCGAGRDTVILLKHGWTVVSYDINNNAQYILERITPEERSRFTFVKSRHQDAEIPKCDLVVANDSMHYLSKEEFKTIIDKIYDSLNPNGDFIAEFLGNKDDWAKNDPDNAFISLKELREIMGNRFEIEAFREHEVDKPTLEGEQKHWHTVSVITRAKNKNLVNPLAKHKKEDEPER